MTHQFNLFPKDKKKAKIPVKRRDIEKLMNAIATHNKKEALERMSDLLEYSEGVERRIMNGRHYEDI